MINAEIAKNLTERLSAIKTEATPGSRFFLFPDQAAEIIQRLCDVLADLIGAEQVRR